MLITCDIPEAPRPVTYFLMASRGVLVKRRLVHDYRPASFNINITLKPNPDLLTYSCQAASTLGTYGPSSRLQMYWELWASEYGLGWGWGCWLVRLVGCRSMEGLGEGMVDLEMGTLEEREEEGSRVGTEGRQLYSAHDD